MSAFTLSPVAPRAAVRPGQALAGLAVGFVVAIALILVEIDRLGREGGERGGGGFPGGGPPPSFGGGQAP